MTSYESPYYVTLELGIPTATGGLAQYQRLRAKYWPDDRVFRCDDDVCYPVTSPLVLRWKPIDLTAEVERE